MLSMTEQFIKAKKVGTPIIAIRTPDQNATIKVVGEAVKTQTKMKDKTPIIMHDIINGMVGITGEGELAVSALCDGKAAAMVTSKPPDALQRAINEDKGLPSHSVLFIKNAHLYLDDMFVRQCISNLRDAFKQDLRTLVLLGPDFKFPPELGNDIVLLDEALPDTEQLTKIITSAYRSAGFDEPDEATKSKAVDAIIGLPAFPAEQCAMVSLDKELRGLDIAQLWERKRKAIEMVPGLSVFRGEESFDTIGGCDNVKKFLRAFLNGAEPPRLIVFIDEIEKAVGGAAGGGADSSGVSQSLLGTLLSWMQDYRAAGAIFIGPPGAAKSAIAKATGNTAGIPTVEFDMNGMKDSLVGASEANLRNGLKTVNAMGQGRVFFIATCNRIADLPPELRRRFTLGTFFFDLPDKAERQAIWDIYQNKYNCVGQKTPQDEGWTGAEIEQCCRLAYLLSMSLVDAAAFIVPVAVSASDKIEELRTQASGRFISASRPGYYQHDKSDAVATKNRAKNAGRMLEGFASDED